MAESPRRRTRQTPEQLAKTRRNHILLLGFLVLIVYASAMAGEFVWTDREDLQQGGHRITALGDLAEAFTSSRAAYRLRDSGASTDPSAGTWQPLTLLSNSISWGIWGDCAFCFHLENVLLHGLVVIGLYALGRHLLSQRRHGVRMAAWAAAVYAVHPATVPSVAWIGGRAYLLTALFSVSALYCFTRLQATTKSHHGPARQWLPATALTALAAMLADETAYVLPFAALLVAGFESRERGRPALTGISPVRLKGLAALLGVLLLVVAYRGLVLGGLGSGAEYPTTSVVNNAGTALRHLWYFIELALLPSEPIISDAWRITLSWGAVEVAALLGLLLILGATSLGLWVGQPIALGVAWFLLWLVPGFGLFPSDHYHNTHAIYLALWGAAFAVVFGLFKLWRPIGRQLMPGSEAVAFVPIILVLGIITGFSNARWWSHSGLFQSEIAGDPHYIEGRLELAKVALGEDRATDALNHTLAAIEASRDAQFTGYWPLPEAYLLLGRAQWALAMYDTAAGSLDQALATRPGDARTLYWLGMTQLSQGEYAAASSNLRKALDAKKDFPEAEADLGVALAGQKLFVEAYPLLAQAIQRGLGNARRHQAMAITMIDARDFRGAAEQLELALGHGEDATERARLAWVHWQLGETGTARSHLDRALQADGQKSEYLDWVRLQIEGSATPAGDG